MRLHHWIRTTLPVLAVLAVLGGAARTPAAAQEAIRATPIGPEIADIHIEVWDLDHNRRLGEYDGGETLSLQVGDSVQLRLVAVPKQHQRNTIYPAGTFREHSGKARILLSNADERRGTVNLRAVRPDNPGNQEATTMVRFDVTGPVNMPERFRGGYLLIDVAEPKPELQPEPQPEPQRDDRGLTLYEHQDFHGTWETFTHDVRDLRGTRIQQDRASSVRIDRGCKATLYEHPGFQGKATVVTEDIVDLRDTRVGSDTVSSFTLECWGSGSGGHDGDHDGGYDGGDDREPGVTLFEHQDFQGAWEKFTHDVRDLRGTRIRQDSASSVRIDRGCEAILYEHPDFEGRATVVNESIVDLRDTRVGNDTVSSLEINCRRFR
jgi:hypothetical protein